MTPFQAGLGALVDLEKSDFIGREALINADRDYLLFGFQTLTDKPTESFNNIDLKGSELFMEEAPIGRIRASVFSPYLCHLIGYIRLYKVGDWPGKIVKICNSDGSISDVQICELPFYDQEKYIPRTLNAKVPYF